MSFFHLMEVLAVLSVPLVGDAYKVVWVDPSELRELANRPKEEGQLLFFNPRQDLFQIRYELGLEEDLYQR